MMTDDEWQAHITREAARAAGAWLEARRGLHRPIRSLTMGELEAMTSNAIARFIVLASERIGMRRTRDGDLARLLMTAGPVPFADAKPEASDSASGCNGTATPITASARCAASMPDRRSPGGLTA